MSKKNKDVMVLGFALFSMLFGAGNLIFPPFLGSVTSSGWLLSSAGFITTGVGLTIVGIVISAKNSENVYGFGEKVGVKFAKILGLVCMLSIGPLLAIPRTAATTYEITVAPIFGNDANIVISSLIFFAVTLYFSLNESKAIEVIGKILTPALLFMMFLIIIKAIVTPMEGYKEVEGMNFYLLGFNEGYQTMDAMASMFLFTLVIQSLKERGYNSKKEMFNMSIKTGAVAGLALSLIYFGLCYVGAKSSNIIVANSRAELLIKTTRFLWGDFGAYALGIAMLLACLTTSIGLTCTVGGYLADVIKVPYKAMCIGITVFSFFASVIGLDAIISVSYPILIAVYPMIIILLILNIFDKFISNKAFYKGAVLVAFLSGIIQSLAIIVTSLKINENFVFIMKLDDILQNKMPFSSMGMPYLIPAIVVGLIFSIIFSKSKKI